MKKWKKTCLEIRVSVCTTVWLKKFTWKMALTIWISVCACFCGVVWFLEFATVQKAHQCLTWSSYLHQYTKRTEITLLSRSEIMIYILLMNRLSMKAMQLSDWDWAENNMSMLWKRWKYSLRVIHRWFFCVHLNECVNSQ